MTTHKGVPPHVCGSSVDLPDVSATLKAKVSASEEDQIDAEKLSNLYDSMANKFVEEGLNLDAVGAMAQYFAVEGDQARPLAYEEFPVPLPENSVRLFVLFLKKHRNEHLAKMAYDAAREIEKNMPAGFLIHLNEPQHYHMTVYMTSQPFDIRSNPFSTDIDGNTDTDGNTNASTITNIGSSIYAPTEEVIEQEINAMREVVETMPAIVLHVYRLLLADSGTLILCFVEKSVDSCVFGLRKAAREAFPGGPIRQSTIYHVSLGRIVSKKQLDRKDRDRLREICDRWNDTLKGLEFKATEVSYVMERKFTTVDGPTVSLRFPTNLEG